MREIIATNHFKKGLKKVLKRNLDKEKLQNIVLLLVGNKPLPKNKRPHMLSGEWLGFWECHIEPDWLLIYDISNPKLLVLHRTGTHADLFE